MHQEFDVQRADLSALGGAFPCWNSSLRVRKAAFGKQREVNNGLISVLVHDTSAVVMQMPFHERKTNGPTSSEKETSLEVHTTCKSSSLLHNAPTTSVCCHEWSDDGRFLVVTSDQTLLWYDAQSAAWECVATFQLRYAINAIAIHAIQRDPSNAKESVASNAKTKYFVAIGTNFGCFVFRMTLSPSHMELVNVPVEQIVVNCVTFAGDGVFLGVGTMDGRFFVHEIACEEFDTAKIPDTTDNTSGVSHATVLATTLATPRVTSIQFSHDKMFVAVAARQGNVYVFKRMLKDQQSRSKWALHRPCQEMIRTPKCMGRACSTQLCWWGTSTFLVISGRNGTAALEVFDALSGLLCHRLELGNDIPGGVMRPAERVPHGDQNQAITGLDCYTAYDKCSGRPNCSMVCLDSSSVLHILTWSFVNDCYNQVK